MNQGKYIFAQLTDSLPCRVFDNIVSRYDGNKKVRSFTCWNQMLCMIFGQLTARDSMRDLMLSLEAHKSKYYHLGLGRDFVFITNNMDLTAIEIALLYKKRWMVELFFYMDSNIMWRRLTSTLDYLLITDLLNSSTPHNNRVPAYRSFRQSSNPLSFSHPLSTFGFCCNCSF